MGVNDNENGTLSSFFVSGIGLLKDRFEAFKCDANDVVHFKLGKLKQTKGNVLNCFLLVALWMKKAELGGRYLEHTYISRASNQFYLSCSLVPSNMNWQW